MKLKIILINIFIRIFYIIYAICCAIYAILVITHLDLGSLTPPTKFKGAPLV